ncbi:MAG: NADPH-dependent glutamate synthase [Clostridiales bacterium]
MINKSNKKTPIPEQKPDKRIKNFLEVSLGYDEKMAISEAQRCLNCKHQPCIKACPVNVKIPEFIELLSKGEFKAAYEKVCETNSLPGICGRVCPQETQCEDLCVRNIKGESVSIGRLERFVSDWYLKNVKNEKIIIQEKNNTKIAIIGSGPASLVCAGDLAKLGYDVSVFEAFHIPGGVLMYGIPEFRLPKSLVQKEIDKIKNLGVNIKTNMVIGKTLNIEDLKEEGYKAIFIGTGAGLPKLLNIPGENLNGVYFSNEFLARINLMKAYDFPNVDTPVKIGSRVAVLGGGNVAMDSARSAKRLGADKVYILYRRTEKEMPARAEEIEHAKEEGIEFKYLISPVRIIGSDKGSVSGIENIKMKLGEPDSSGRRRPIAIENSEYIIDIDTIVSAIGQNPNKLVTSTTKDLKTEAWGGITVYEDSGLTSKEGVFAGGDAVTGAATVILAMGAGKKSAVAIDKYIKTCKN